MDESGAWYERISVVCEMCMFLARGSVGGEWIRGLG